MRVQETTIWTFCYVRMAGCTNSGFLVFKLTIGSFVWDETVNPGVGVVTIGLIHFLLGFAQGNQTAL